ncbi:VanW family protein [Phytoactinopolyspora endophytica]|uniref:VanW family protein n=1 Tax=Phytoactinopolyspora endophytica TaxID=1642495 RepID=UPI001F11119E|nr:VanW family protein [Phytoactinopolyspora endophytica]
MPGRNESGDESPDGAVDARNASAAVPGALGSAAAGAPSQPPTPPQQSTQPEQPTPPQSAIAVQSADQPTEEVPAVPATAPGDDGGSDKPSRRGRKAAIIVGLVVVVLGVAYGVTYLLAGGKLAQNATVAGIEVGGLTPAEARDRLDAELPAVVDEPIHLHLGETDAMYDVVPSEAGMGIDVPATVAAVPGGSANPVSLVKALFGGDEVEPRPEIDPDRLRSSLEGIAEQSDTEPVNGSVAFEDGEVVTSEPVTGTSLDVDGAIDVLSDAFFGGEAREMPIGDLTVPVDENQPNVTEADLSEAVSEFAEPAMSGPVTVVAGDESIELPPEMIGQSLKLSPNENGALQPELDGEKLAELADDELAELGQEGKDATITIENGEPVVVPAEAGQGIEKSSLGDAVLLALTEDGDGRRAEVEMVDVDPELTTEGAEELGVKEVVAEFTTTFPPTKEYRNVNIGRAAELIDNTFLAPGDEFSLNDIVGERTEANGFTSGTIINGGRLESSLGGGVSQVATTAFHAAFQAGLEDVEHWPHSIYFSRYPIAQEATVAWGAKDMRFANDTPYGVLVDTEFTPSAGQDEGVLTVRIWSTEHYEVETSVSERSNFTSPQTIYDTGADCEQQAGSQGFDITSYRKVWTLDGELVKDEADPWTYNPNHQVICGPDPDDGGSDDD